MREPEGHVDRLLEVDDLERPEPLVVVEGDRHVEFASQLPPEERVRRLRAGKAGEARAKGVQDRIDRVELLPTDQAALAGVRVEPADADPGRRDALGPG